MTRDPKNDDALLPEDDPLASALRELPRAAAPAELARRVDLAARLIEGRSALHAPAPAGLEARVLARAAELEAARGASADTSAPAPEAVLPTQAGIRPPAPAPDTPPAPDAVIPAQAGIHPGALPRPANRRAAPPRQRPVYYSTQGLAERWRPRAFPRQWLTLVAGACVLAVGLQVALETQRLEEAASARVTEPAFSDPRIVWVDPVTPSAPLRALAEANDASEARAASPTPQREQGFAMAEVPPLAAPPAVADVLAEDGDDMARAGAALADAGPPASATPKAEARAQADALATTEATLEPEVLPAEGLAAAGLAERQGDGAEEPATVEDIPGETRTESAPHSTVASRPAETDTRQGESLERMAKASGGKVSAGWFGPFTRCTNGPVPQHDPAPRELRSGDTTGEFVLVAAADGDASPGGEAICLRDTAGQLAQLLEPGSGNPPQGWEWRIEADGRIAIRPPHGQGL